MPGPTEDPTVVHPGFSAPEGAAALPLRQLAQVGAELAAADTMADVVTAAVTHAATAIGAAVTTLMIVEGDELVLVAGHGLQPGIQDRWQRFGLHDVNPASEATRTGQPIGIGSPAQIEERYPSLRGQVPDGRSLLCVPLGSARPAAGALGLTFEQGWLPGPGELAFLTTFAEACGQAVRRIQLLDQARERAEQLTFLARASVELASDLDYRKTLTNTARLAVDSLADWCTIAIEQEDGTIATLAVAHVDPAKVRWAWDLQERYPPDQSAPTGAPNVARTGVSELHATITDDTLAAAARDEQHLALLRDLDLRSAMVVPLIARGRPLGAITLVRAGSKRAFTPADLAVAEDLGRRAGVAIDNAILFEQAQDVALQLQWAVLPDALGAIPDWQLATHYAPGGSAEVGGDFYDAIALDRDRLAFAIGDVMGHGVRAAAAMAQMRAAVRAYVCIDPDPGRVCESLERMFDTLHLTGMVTLIYGVIDAAAHEIALVNAGHYQPLIISAAGAVRAVESTPRVPFGAGHDDRTAVRSAFADTDTLLLFTDGLIEHRDESEDDGLERLVAEAPCLVGADLATGLDHLVARVAPVRGHDDITAFAVRRAR